MRPSDETSIVKFVPSVSVTWACAIAAIAVANNATGNRSSLACTFHPYVTQFLAINFERDLHRLTADLAVLDVRLRAGGGVDQHGNRLCAVRAMTTFFGDEFVHQMMASGLQACATPFRCRE